jgi:ribosomal protein L28
MDSCQAQIYGIDKSFVMKAQRDQADAEAQPLRRSHRKNVAQAPAVACALRIRPRWKVNLHVVKALANGAPKRLRVRASYIQGGKIFME